MACSYRSKLSDLLLGGGLARLGAGSCIADQMKASGGWDMTGSRSKAQEDVRFRVLCLLRDNPEMSQRDLSQAVGVSNGSIHYVLSALIDKGWVKLGRFKAAQDKRRYAYVLTGPGLAARATLTRNFLIRKVAEYEALRAEIEAISSDLSERELGELQINPARDATK